ncbi:MAG: c-type cytochrome [Planctomycetota bacterium]
MGKKLFFWFVGIAGPFMLVYGCQNMAVQMSGGEKLYRAKCSSCHSVIAPGNHDEEQWCLYVDKYGKKMTDEEKRIVLEYLVAVD